MRWTGWKDGLGIRSAGRRWKFPQPYGLPDSPVVDELGRAWLLPLGCKGLQPILNDYIQPRGLPLAAGLSAAQRAEASAADTVRF
jgi:hypothetical protein